VSSSSLRTSTRLDLLSLTLSPLPAKETRPRWLRIATLFTLRLEVKVYRLPPTSLNLNMLHLSSPLQRSTGTLTVKFKDNLQTSRSDTSSR